MQRTLRTRSWYAQVNIWILSSRNVAVVPLSFFLPFFPTRLEKIRHYCEVVLLFSVCQTERNSAPPRSMIHPVYSSVLMVRFYDTINRRRYFPQVAAFLPEQLLRDTLILRLPERHTENSAVGSQLVRGEEKYLNATNLIVPLSSIDEQISFNVRKFHFTEKSRGRYGKATFRMIMTCLTTPDISQEMTG